MKMTYRTALSALAAIGIAVTGIAANSANAYSKSLTLPPRPATATDGFRTAVVTYRDRAQESGNNMGLAQLERNYGAPGRDRLMIVAAAGAGTENVALASWSCRAKLYNSFFLVKQTSAIRTSKTNPAGYDGLTAFPTDASGSDKTYPRVTATSLRAECS